jgi:hypothetical protein
MADRHEKCRVFIAEPSAIWRQRAERLAALQYARLQNTAPGDASVMELAARQLRRIAMLGQPSCQLEQFVDTLADCRLERRC